MPDAGCLALIDLSVADYYDRGGTRWLRFEEKRGTERIVLPISPQQRRHLAPMQRGTPPYHQLSTVNSNACARLGTMMKRNTPVGPQLPPGRR